MLERKFGSPDIVRDGSTVAKEIEIENPISNLGAKLIEQVASKTKESAGDGTTTAVVVPSPALSFVLEATCSINFAPKLEIGFSISISLATVDPSLTISGEPNFLSNTTFFAFGQKQKT